MAAIWRTSVFIFIVTSSIFSCLGTLAAAQPPDQLAAARVLGPHWKRNVRAAGMVFAGTLLSVEASKQSPVLPVVQLKFRVDRAIAGVRAGQVLTIREWTGAVSTRPAVRPGQHVLLLLYPPSWLGLTSPVGGISGQIVLDANGQIHRHPTAAARSLRSGAGPTPGIEGPAVATGKQPAIRQITVAQLEGAIRRAREE